MNLVRLNHNGLVRDLAHEAFFRNFADSYHDSAEHNDITGNIDYNVSEQDNEFTLEIAIPGFSKDDLTIEVENGMLAIATKIRNEENERSGFAAKDFSKRFKLSKKVNQDEITAKSENGVLTVQLPKVKEAIKKPARIIEVA